MILLYFLMYVVVGVWLAGPLFSGLYLGLLGLSGREIRFVGWYRWYAARFELISTQSWYARQWLDWTGCGLFGFMITRNSSDTTLLHESRHCLQHLILGGWFYVFYGLNSVFIYLFLEDLHAYLDNWFERNARGYAQQPVFIPRAEWGAWSTNRWPWW